MSDGDTGLDSVGAGKHDGASSGRRDRPGPHDGPAGAGGHEDATGEEGAAPTELFAAHERFLWGLCYRMTGCAADADDLVQETFARALARPPRDTSAPWRPWLTRVAMNLSRDQLRRRRRQRYVGPWLPSPLETGDEASPPSYEPTDQLEPPPDALGRYDQLESVTFAFLIALEALTPQQRAVLLLRDVFDYSVEETAGALELSQANVRTTHHRARKVMASYDQARCVPTRERQERTQRALERLLAALASQDVAAIEALLSEDVRAVNDGAGEFLAARKPIHGRRLVALFHKKLGQRPGVESMRTELRMINGLPAVVLEIPDAGPGVPPRSVFQIQIDGAGRLLELSLVLATRKLTGVRFGL